LYLSNFHFAWVPLAHTYNPSYSGGRDQEDRGLKPAWANRFLRPYLEKTHYLKKKKKKKRAGEKAQVVEYLPSTCKA
jgi:hypothetical protein